MLRSPAPPAACRCGCPAGTHWMISILSASVLPGMWSRYAELTCDHFWQNRCDAHFTLWGEASDYAKDQMKKAVELDHCIKLYPPRRKKEAK